MCAIVGVGNQTIQPGAELIYRCKDGGGYVRWGIPYGGPYNARVESLPILWRKCERIICPVDVFYEGGKPFGILGKKTNLAAIIELDSILIVTRPPIELIKPYHKRMPLVLSDDEEYLEQWYKRSPLIPEIDYNLLKMVS